MYVYAPAATFRSQEEEAVPQKRRLSKLWPKVVGPVEVVDISLERGNIVQLRYPSGSRRWKHVAHLARAYQPPASEGGAPNDEGPTSRGIWGVQDAQSLQGHPVAVGDRLGVVREIRLAKKSRGGQMLIEFDPEKVGRKQEALAHPSLASRSGACHMHGRTTRACDSPASTGTTRPARRLS